MLLRNYFHGTNLATCQPPRRAVPSKHQTNKNTMRKLILSVATVLCCTTAFAQEKTTVTKEATPATMQAGDELTEAKMKLSGDLKNSIGTAEMLISKAKNMSGAEPSKAETYMKMIESVTATRDGLMEQLNVVNQATAANSKEVFAKAATANTEATESFANFKKEMAPEGK